MGDSITPIVCGLMIVQVAPGAFTEIRRFPNGWFTLHPHNSVVVATGPVDSSKYYCLGREGVLERLQQPTTFNAAWVHATAPSYDSF